MIHPSKILRELGISALKHLGQNFQVDTHVVANAATAIPATARILEIGPGLGAWTEIFFERGHEMVLVEKDRTLARRLTERFAGEPRVTVIEADFLELDIGNPEVAGCTAAIGNLPFYITSELLLRLLSDCQHIAHGLFGVQLEVAERLASGRGSSLAIALGSQGRISLSGKISRHSFYPAPNVDAALMSFERSLPTIARPHLRLLLKAAFWGKRKQLATALRKNPFWEKDSEAAAWPQKLENPPPDIAELLKQRADEPGVAEYCRLYDFLTGEAPDPKPEPLS